MLNLNYILPKIDNGFNKYNNLMELVNKVNVAESRDFQKAYNGFYKMRQRSKEFYTEYYRYMEESKGKMINFEDVLYHIYNRTGRIEASFSSKLLATLNPKMPVWDVYVMQNLGLTKPSGSKEKRLSGTVEMYTKMLDWYSEFLKSDEAEDWLTKFDNYFVGNELTDVKKVDFILWQNRVDLTNETRDIKLSQKLYGHSIFEKVIPTVCSLKSMLHHLIELGGDYSSLKSWEKSCYNSYLLGEIKIELMNSDEENRKLLIRKHLLESSDKGFRANVKCIYVVGYVAKLYGPGKGNLRKFVFENGISDRENSVNAIWSVGKGDGEYLGILDNNGRFYDMDFLRKWISL